MSKSYISISSAYRNRNQFPNPAQFDLPISQYGDNITPEQAVDPVISSYPILAFDCSIFPLVDNFMGGTNTEPILSPPPALPSGYPIGDDFYTGLELKDNASGEIVSITSYDSLTHRVTINPAFSETWTAVTYTISFPIYVSTTNIFIPSGTYNNGAYVGYSLEDVTINEIRTISNYDGDNRIATVSVAFGAGWANTDTYSLRPSAPFVFGQAVLAVGTYTYLGTTYQYVRLAATSAGTEDVYKNCYFFDNTLYIAGTTPNFSLIVKYWGVPPVGSGLPNNVALLKTTLTTLAPADVYDILGFTRDNFSPLVFNKTITDQLACYEVELVSLVLPNVDILSSSGGGRAINIPYVYVEFSNYNTNMTDLISSNNLSANRALFLVSLNDYPSIFNSPFVRVDGGSQLQILKFKNGDNFKFSVYLPNGELFITTTEDFFSPLAPNNSLQIEMTISVRRLR